MSAKVLVVTPYPKDANSYYRCMGPWNYLSKQHRDVEICLAQDHVGIQGVAWDTVSQFDAVFMHRPCRQDDITILQVARLMNVPVWVDYDDWLLDVPYWNPTAGIYSNPGVQQAMALCTACADVISVSTAALYDRLRVVNPNVVILPNMYRSDLYPYRAKKSPKRQNEFVWRGTNTHDADLLSVVDAFEHLPGKVTFFGGPFWGVTSRMPQGSFEIRGHQDPFLYMRALYEWAPKVMLVPLVDTFFNRVKSNIAYQEALHAGALTVAPDLPEWKRPGVITYAPGESASFLAAAASALALSETEHEQQVAKAWDHMLELYDGPQVDRLRYDTLTAILAKDFERNRRDPFDQLTGLWCRGQLTGQSFLPTGTPKEALQKAGVA